MNQRVEQCRRAFARRMWAKVRREGIFTARGVSSAKEHFVPLEEGCNEPWSKRILIVLLVLPIIIVIALIVWFRPPHSILFPDFLP